MLHCRLNFFYATNIKRSLWVTFIDMVCYGAITGHII